MRVITGLARGRKLKDFEGRDIRPTTDMVKEAMFSVIQFDIEGRETLDLFSGTGQLGIEALSRGAKFCRFVDKAKESADLTRENIALAGFKDKSNVINADSIDFLRMGRYKFDLAFLDPPYNKGLIENALPLLEPMINEGGIVVCEHEKETVLPECVGKLKVSKVYKYGKTAVTVYKADAETD